MERILICKSIFMLLFSFLDSVLVHFFAGLFRKSDEKMVCSALSNFTGGIFILYSEPEVRGKGYAKLLVQRMIQEIRKRGRIPYCTIIINNEASEKVFSKIGFEVFAQTHYIYSIQYLEYSNTSVIIAYLC